MLVLSLVACGYGVGIPIKPEIIAERTYPAGTPIWVDEMTLVGHLPHGSLVSSDEKSWIRDDGAHCHVRYYTITSPGHEPYGLDYTLCKTDGLDGPPSWVPE